MLNYGTENVDVVTRTLMSYSNNDAHIKLIPITIFIIAFALLTCTYGESLRSQFSVPQQTYIHTNISAPDDAILKGIL